MAIGKKIINDPRQVVPEVLEGLVAASHGRLSTVNGTSAVVRTELPSDRVGLLIGGGSGHEPLFAGFVGDGLADVAACGDIFAAPAPDVIPRRHQRGRPRQRRPLRVRELRGRQPQLRHGGGARRR